MTSTRPRSGGLPAAIYPLVFASACLATLVACGGGGSSASGISGSSQFLVVRTDPPNGGGLYLNDSFTVDFSSEVDLSTADLSSVAFTTFDLNGNPVDEQPAGEFKLAAASGDDFVGRRLEFAPHFPTNDTYDNGGFRPGRRYVVSILGGDGRPGTILRDKRGKTLSQTATFEFSTADGTTPGQLFRDTVPGGPKRVTFTVTPTGANGESSLSLLGQVPVEVRMTFDQPLNPASVNVPVGFDTNPVNRSISKRGRIYLEYDDPDPARGKNTWIPAAVLVTSNSLAGATVVLRPLGVLPNVASVRAVVLPELEDMSGQSNAGDGTYDRVFGSFQTRSGYEPQFDAVVERFETTADIDLEAPFVDPKAEYNPGYLKANFEFEGSVTSLNYKPTSREVILNTDYTQIVPDGASPINVSGGVFNFNNVEIPAGVSVKGIGTKPMVWLVTGDFTVSGELSVTGGEGARVDTLNSANFPTPGGVGACGGGNGGRGSANAVGPTYPETEAGYGANQVPSGGGKGGKMACSTSCVVGSGGGGGSMATQGDPNFKTKKGAGSSFQQQIGKGGNGCTGGSGTAGRSLDGGLPGPLVFSDKRTDNNFWGSGVNLQRQIRIPGELKNPTGGQGGGGGGDLSQSYICSTNNPNWANDNKGGGGGAGGGVIVVKALGSIIIKSTGTIRADGGHGNGGEMAGSNGQGGGGGGGSGGMVVLMAGRKITIETHGETYANNDYNFAVSADGAVSKKGNYTGTQIDGKYNSIYPATTWDETPTGGFGGMGVVQLMAPAGDNGTDGTGTVLDDNIDIYKGTLLLTGAEKKRFLAWRGFPNAAGTLVDDLGNPTNIGDAEGDIRPSPTLLPAPYGAKSRARSKWFDTGASVRRAEFVSGDGQARGVVPQTISGTKYGAGPVYSFAGTFTDANTKRGYIAYETVGAGVAMNFPVPPALVSVMPAEVGSTSTNASFDGRPAYQVVLRQSVLGSLANLYAQNRLELLDASGSKLGEFRILAHDDKVLWLAPEGMLFPNQASVAKARIVQKYFDLITNKSPGFGGVTPGGTKPVPVANVQIGFAFHKDPSTALTSGADPNRYPQGVGTFAFDLSDPSAVTAMRDKPFVQWEMLFNTLYSEAPGNLRADPLKPGIPRPEIHAIAVPYRF